MLPFLLQDLSALEKACAAASPTVLINWGLDGERNGDSGATLKAGTAMGCEDGSVYLFSGDLDTKGTSRLVPVELTHGKHAASTLHVALASHLSREPSPSPSNSSSLRDPTHSRRASNSIHVPHPLSQPTRSRVTSFVSRTSAEAPKNYVGFDDEKERLEGLLKGGPSAKGKSIIDGFRAAYGVVGLGPPGGTDANGGSHHKNHRLSFAGSTPTSGTPRDSSSSPPSPVSPSSPPPGQSPPITELGRSPRVGRAPPLILKFHVFPPRCGSGHSVVALHRLSSGTLLSLQESGYDRCIA